jgi:hypothetical protein
MKLTMELAQFTDGIDRLQYASGSHPLDSNPDPLVDPPRGYDACGPWIYYGELVATDMPPRCTWVRPLSLDEEGRAEKGKMDDLIEERKTEEREEEAEGRRLDACKRAERVLTEIMGKTPEPLSGDFGAGFVYFTAEGRAVSLESYARTIKGEQRACIGLALGYGKTAQTPPVFWDIDDWAGGDLKAELAERVQSRYRTVRKQKRKSVETHEVLRALGNLLDDLGGER